jgi:non-ribosomal peptide synthetase component E (peptide arylation enzyme)
MLTFEDAWMRVGLAGRELGSGPAVAARRLCDFDEATRWLVAHGVKPATAGSIALGVAVGLVMAENPDALDTLAAIEREWYAGI